MHNAPKPGTRVRFYRFRNMLRDKLGGANAAGAATAPAISDEVMAKVQSALDELSEDYPDWIMRTVDELRAYHAHAAEAPQTRRKDFDAIRSIAQELKGQGGCFGYPLVTTFSHSLAESTGLNAPLTDATVDIVKSHVDAIAAVIKERVKGNGGEVGRELAAQLKSAIEKLSVTA